MEPRSIFKVCKVVGSEAISDGEPGAVTIVVVLWTAGNCNAVITVVVVVYIDQAARGCGGRVSARTTSSIFTQISTCVRLIIVLNDIPGLTGITIVAALHLNIDAVARDTNAETLTRPMGDVVIHIVAGVVVVPEQGLAIGDSTFGNQLQSRARRGVLSSGTTQRSSLESLSSMHHCEPPDERSG